MHFVNIFLMFSIIIPIRIDHYDRFMNAEITINYLMKNLENESELILIENGDNLKFEDMAIYNKKKIIYLRQISKEKTFDRMKCINDGLLLAKYPITLIYDIDVLLPLKTFQDVKNMIINEKYDIVQPFSNPPGCIYIHQINKPDIFKKIQSNDNYDISNYSKNTNDEQGFAGKGFVVCVNTEVYKSLGGENEDFKAYGPEDNERYYRFKRLEKKIGNTNNCVYHLEHHRTPNSNASNPNFKKNCELFEKIQSMSKNELEDYYMSKSRFF